MLNLDIVRSPFAHARIKSINTERALKVPGVLAVITGETLAKYNLHEMPTLMSDTLCRGSRAAVRRRRWMEPRW
jgi:carbon-monoxide dehydrogenase large subunit